VRARLAAVRSLRQARQQLTSFLLRHGHHYHRPAWTLMHRRWMAGLRFENAARHTVLEDCIAAVEAATARRDRLEAHIEAALPDWSLAPVVQALQALRGTALVAAATLVRRTRRHHPLRQSLSAHGVSRPGSVRALEWRRTPSGRHHEIGEWRGPTNADRGGRSYRFPARISREQLLRQEGLAKPIRDIGLIEARAYDSLDICGDLFGLVRLLLADADAENNSPAPHPVAAEITGLAIERAELFVDLLFQVRARPTIRIL
jgi:transposase